VQPLRKLKFQVIAFVFPLAASLAFIAAAQPPVPAGVESIRADKLRERLTYIASEKFKGRGNGTPELDMAADYIAGVFQQNGLKPAGENGSYYQHFDIYSARLGARNALRFDNVNGARLDAKVRADFMPELWSASGTVTAPMVLVEDNHPPNLKGKIAVEFEDRIVSDDPEFPIDATEGRKLQEAGAVAVIIVQSLSDHTRSRIAGMTENFRDDLPVRMTSMAIVDAASFPEIPSIMLSADTGRQLLTDLRKSPVTVTATLTVDVERLVHHTQNVLALIEGSDPVLKNEVMVVGAHYDHDGEAYGQIWYGADDNGSGTAALLELAEAFGPGSPRPARSVLLASWAGEEKGELGSRYYVNHSVYPLSRTIAMFQMDMIGRNEEHSGNRAQQVPEERAADNVNALNVIGSAFSPEMKTLVSKMNNETKLNLHFRYDFAAEDLMRRSDQWSFVQKGIPGIFFFTGLHPDYHTPRDTPDKINYAKLEKVARLVYLTSLQLANNPGRPQFVKAY
jgi:hypothetical protein